MGLIDELNEKQREAVIETEGYVRVIAGAGSGKTKLLVNRYAYLVQEYGIDPANILCVTFTNKAAGEMKRRIRAIIGGEYDTALICTYHGFCARLLRDDAEKLFLSKDFQIVDVVQQKTILGDIYQKRELKLDYASFEKILKMIGKYKSVRYHEYVPNMVSPERRQIMDSISTMDDKIIEEYMQRQKSINALDFHDLLSFALYLLETNDKVRTHWQNKLNYIQVDEFQDSSTREMKLIDILSDSYRNLLIVGDPDQNIYEWRGSNVNLLVNFDKAHEPTKTIFLNRNYRSTPQILDCANSLIDYNKLRLKKDLFTKLSKGADVTHYHSKSDDKETEKIAELIKNAVRKDGKRFSDIAILYRSSFMSRLVENRLVEKNIPYEIYGGVKFFQRMEVLDMIAYLRVIAFGDDVSTKRIINKPRRRFGRVKLAALEELQERLLINGEETISLFDVLSKNLGDVPFKNSDANAFVKLINNIKKEAGKLRISEIVNRVATESGYEEYIRSLGDEERYKNLMEFKRVASEFERNFGEDIDLPQFLQQLSLQSSEDSEKENDTVKLMTIHAAKGLEFPIVFVIGFSEGIFPSSKTIEERKLLGLEEERRLCYVAITRAKEQLYIMDSEGFSQNGIKKLPSRFLREIGTTNYNRIGVISDELDRESKEYTKRLNSGFEVEEKNQYHIGDEVEHHAFGKGKVVSYDPRRNSLTVTFEKIGQTRTLNADYFTRTHTIPTVRDSSSEAYKTEISEKDFEEIENESDEVELNPETTHKEEKPDESSKTSQDDMTAEQRLVIPEYAEIREEAATSGNSETDSNADESIKMNEELKRKLADTPNLWKRDDVPHSGWTCVGVSDLGAPVGVCEMCGYQIIRYVHHMTHPSYRPLDVGCICAGKMEGNLEQAIKRENDFKNKEARRKNFMKRKWKTSKNGNQYLKIKDHIIVIYLKNDGVRWSYSLDSKFCNRVFISREKAIEAAFEALDKILRA
ncbi:MAG: UvrD-helicase domain-containing protein [Ruminococcus sp.]|nr:UvrD-helicase domain-containing protein [Ruminococcus sp.]